MCEISQALMSAVAQSVTYGVSTRYDMGCADLHAFRCDVECLDGIQSTLKKKGGQLEDT